MMCSLARWSRVFVTTQPIMLPSSSCGSITCSLVWSARRWKIAFLRSGTAVLICPESYARVHEGDVIAFAFNGQVPDGSGVLTTLAFIEGEFDPFLMPETERTTVAQVRELLTLPPSDMAAASVVRDAIASISAALALGIAVALRRRLNGLILGGGDEARR